MSEHDDAEQKSNAYRVSYDAEPLSPKQSQAALMLAEGASSVDVAKYLKVTPQTIVEWKKKHLFQAEYNQHRKDIVDSTRERIRQGIKQASDTLVELLGDSDSKVRLSAARTLLDKIDEPEQSGWGIGESTVQGLIEAEYLQHQRKQLFGGDTILGGGLSDSVKEAIAEIISNRDLKYKEE